MREMRALWSFILLLLVIVQATTGQAPGDEDERCLEDVVNEEGLMSSLTYRNLISSMGGPWTVVDDDNNIDPCVWLRIYDNNNDGLRLLVLPR